MLAMTAAGLIDNLDGENLIDKMLDSDRVSQGLNRPIFV